MNPLELTDAAQELADEVRRASGTLTNIRNLVEDWERYSPTSVWHQAAKELREIIDD